MAKDFRSFLTGGWSASIAIWGYAGNVAFGSTNRQQTNPRDGDVSHVRARGKTKNSSKMNEIFII